MKSRSCSSQSNPQRKLLPEALKANRKLGHYHHTLFFVGCAFAQECAPSGKFSACNQAPPRYFSQFAPLRSEGRQTKERLILCHQQTTCERAWRFFTTARFPSSWTRNTA